MTLVLGIDIETTGLDPAKDLIIEIGFALWDIERRDMTFAGAYLINHEGIIVPERIVQLTGITSEMLDTCGFKFDYVLKMLGHCARKASYIVAHNAPFERSFFQYLGVDFGKPWIDTKADLPYRAGMGEGQLLTISAKHGFLNPFPHRALPDVLTMLKLLSMYDFATVVDMASQPSFFIDVTFEYDPSGAAQGQIKELGYHWVPEKKAWRRKVKRPMVTTECEKLKRHGFTRYDISELYAEEISAA